MSGFYLIFLFRLFFGSNISEFFLWQQFAIGNFMQSGLNSYQLGGIGTLLLYHILKFIVFTPVVYDQFENFYSPKNLFNT